MTNEQWIMEALAQIIDRLDKIESRLTSISSKLDRQNRKRKTEMADLVEIVSQG